jgi:AcrR family transcriptional regulator
MAEPAVETRAERRKRATEVRLLDAALEVFCTRGYDAATTGEMARAADVAAGTFYLHFRDKRAAYERLARRAAHDLLGRWRAAMRPGMRVADRVVLALRLAAEFWRADPRRARLLLEGGPSFGSEGHLRFVDEIAAALAAAGRGRRSLPARPLALLVAGMGIELGRLIVADPAADVDGVLHLVRRSLSHLNINTRRIPPASPASPPPSTERRAGRAPAARACG